MTIRKFIIVAGAQGGNEGKSRIVDELIARNVEEHGAENVVVLGSNGGSNNERCISINEKEYNVHYLTSGTVTPGVIQVLGSGKVIEPISVKDELSTLTDFTDLLDRTYIDENTHITTIPHILLDKRVKSNENGTTLKGIGPTYSTKYTRMGIRIKDAIRMTDDELRVKLQKLYKSMGFSDLMDLKFNYVDFSENPPKPIYLKTHEILSGDYDIKNIRWIISTFKIVNHLWFRENLFPLNKVFIVELSYSLLLDITNGTYPNVTNSNCTSSGIFESLGLSLMDMLQLQNNIEIIGVMKSYPSRVDFSCLPSLMKDNDEFLDSSKDESIVTNDIKRFSGWPDVVLARYSSKINGYTSFNITGLDNLSHLDKIKVCVEYRTKTGQKVEYFPSSDEILSELIPVYEELDGWKDYSFKEVKSYSDLHENVKKFIEFMENNIGVPIKYINTGKNRGMMIIKDKFIKKKKLFMSSDI